MKNKIKLFLYSAHGEVVGGDARYFIDLFTNLNPSLFEIHVFTDENKVFKNRFAQWGEGQAFSVKYLPVKPVLFKDNLLDALIKKAFKAKFLQKFNRFGSLLERALLKLVKIIFFLEVIHEVKNYFMFKKIFRDFGVPDVFHSNNGGYPGKRSSITALLAAKRSGVRSIVLSVQNIPVKKRWYRLGDLATDFVVRSCCDHLISPSETIKHMLQSSKRIGAVPVLVIHHGLKSINDLSYDEKTKLGSTLGAHHSDKIKLLIVGHLDEARKGHLVLFEALVLLKQKHSHFVLFVVGDGKRRSVLENFVQNQGLSEFVVFLGYRQDLRELNLYVDIVVQPSTGFEGVPYSIRDAMRAGKPVVATTAGGIEEAVTHELNGLLVPPSDPKALSEALSGLMDSSEKRAQLGLKSLEIFHSKFLLDVMIQAHESLYQNCAQQNAK